MRLLLGLGVLGKSLMRADVDLLRFKPEGGANLIPEGSFKYVPFFLSPPLGVVGIMGCFLFCFFPFLLSFPFPFPSFLPSLIFIPSFNQSFLRFCFIPFLHSFPFLHSVSFLASSLPFFIHSFHHSFLASFLISNLLSFLRAFFLCFLHFFSFLPSPPPSFLRRFELAHYIRNEWLNVCRTYMESSQ